MSQNRADVTEADEDGGGGDEEYEIKALRKTVGSGGKGRDGMHTGQKHYRTMENNKE